MIGPTGGFCPIAVLGCVSKQQLPVPQERMACAHIQASSEPMHASTCTTHSTEPSQQLSDLPLAWSPTSTTVCTAPMAAFPNAYPRISERCKYGMCPGAPAAAWPAGTARRAHWQAAAATKPQAAAAAAAMLARELPPWPSQEFKRTVNPTTLAYLGDAVWTLYVKGMCFAPPKHINLYHAAVKAHVTAEGQAVHCTSLLGAASPLTEPERELVAWVKACPNIIFRKRFATSEQLEAYRSATALEALVGYLHLSNQERLKTCMEFLGAAIIGDAGGGSR